MKEHKLILAGFCCFVGAVIFAWCSLQCIIFVFWWENIGFVISYFKYFPEPKVKNPCYGIFFLDKVSTIFPHY